MSPVKNQHDLSFLEQLLQPPFLSLLVGGPEVRRPGGDEKALRSFLCNGRPGHQDEAEKKEAIHDRNENRNFGNVIYPDNRLINKMTGLVYCIHKRARSHVTTRRKILQ